VVDNRYSVFVSWAKIVLPLGALVLLSTVFFVAQSVTTETSIPFSEIEEVARESRLASPNFAGVTDDGAAFRVSAGSIKPDPTDDQRILVETPSLVAATANAQDISIRSGNGVLMPKAMQLSFGALVRLETSDGYTVETTSLSANLETGLIETDGALEVITPFGALSAGQLVVELGNDESGAKLLFKNGVKMTYQIED